MVEEIIDQKRLDAVSEKAEVIFDSLLEGFTEDDDDAPAVAYVLWIHLTHFLAFCGTPPAKLVQDCIYHAEEQTSAGHA